MHIVSVLQFSQLSGLSYRVGAGFLYVPRVGYITSEITGYMTPAEGKTMEGKN